MNLTCSVRIRRKQASESPPTDTADSRFKHLQAEQIRVEPELRADLDSVLLPGETLTEIVEESVRRAVEFRRVQADFAARVKQLGK